MQKNLDFLTSAISHKVAIHAISGYLASPCASATGRNMEKGTSTDERRRTNLRIFVRICIRHRFLEPVLGKPIGTSTAR